MPLHIDNLQRAVELEKELKLWRDAEARAQPGVFKQARIVVTDAAHGFAPIPGQPPQNTEVVVQLTQEVVLALARQRAEAVVVALRELGVEV